MRGMRTIFGICIFIVVGLVIVSIFSSSPATTSTTFHSLVTQTHQQLNQLHKLKEEFEGDQPLDSSILRNLGFVENPTLFPNRSWVNISSPVIVSAISASQLDRVEDLIELSQLISSNISLVLFGLDLYPEQIIQVEGECNDSCILVQFNFSKFPSHVRDLRLNAYQPIIIQEMAQHAGIVMWIDACMGIVEPTAEPTSLPSENIPSNIFVSKAYNYIAPSNNDLVKNSKYVSKRETRSTNFDLQNSSKTRGNQVTAETSFLDDLVRRAIDNGGIVTWPVSDDNMKRLPTPAMTHPDMFPAFRVQKHDYDFQQMSSPSVLLLLNINTIHNKLLRPWVSCALRQSCLSPIGAQDTGCRYNKKPLFRYSGCHLYDTSAFNVALGIAFGPDTTKYILPAPVFQCMPKDLLGKNSLDGGLSATSDRSVRTRVPNLDLMGSLEHSLKPQVNLQGHSDVLTPYYNRNDVPKMNNNFNGLPIKIKYENKISFDRAKGPERYFSNNFSSPSKIRNEMASGLKRNDALTYDSSNKHNLISQNLVKNSLLKYKTLSEKIADDSILNKESKDSTH